MAISTNLNIQVVATTEGADVFINGKHYYLDPQQIYPDMETLRSVFADQPVHVFNAVVALLQELVTA